MAGITLEQAQEQLDTWLAANVAVAARQRYKINEREMVFTDAKEIRENIVLWDSQVKVLTNRVSGRGRSRTIVCG